MANEKNTTPELEEKAVRAPKQWEYVGPKPAPIISNLPIDEKQPRLGTISEKYLANELPEKYIPYVIKTVKEAKNWWK